MRTNKRPRIIISQVYDVTIDPLLEEIKTSQSVMAFIRTEKGECKFLHTGLGEKDYATALIMLCRNLTLFNFVKLAVKHAELYIENQEEKGFNFTGKALEYLEWKRNNFNQIKPF